MAEIDKHGETWQAVTEWAQKRRGDAVASLIAGSAADDKLRGEIRLIDDLLTLTKSEPPPVPAAHYD